MYSLGIALVRKAEKMLETLSADPEICFRCKALSVQLFSSRLASRQIILILI